MIKADRLTMYYGPVLALDNASFSVASGEVVGLLGPNGAGKSTAMRILTTYLYPTSGTAVVNNFDVKEQPLEVRKSIGYLPETPPLYLEMEVRDYLNFVGSARGLAGSLLKKRIDWALEQCGLVPVYRSLIAELSKGYRQRTALAQALLHDPDVIILDEPTSGLDPHQILEIRQLIRRLAQDKTIILSTHILSEAEAVADRIVIISRGRIVADGTAAQLRHQATDMRQISLHIKAPQADVLRLLEAEAGIEKVTLEAEQDEVLRLMIQTRSESDLSARIGHLVWEKNWEVQQLQQVSFSLEDTFLALTEAEEGAAR